MTDTPLPPIMASIDIAASSHEVWAALVDPASVADWLGCLNFEARVGHTFYMQPDAEKRGRGEIDGATWCDVEIVDAPVCLGFSWYLPGTPKTTVRITLESLDGTVTRVSLVHSGWELFPPELIAPIRAGLEGGWSGHVLPALQALCEARPA